MIVPLLILSLGGHCTSGLLGTDSWSRTVRRASQIQPRGPQIGLRDRAAAPFLKDGEAQYRRREKNHRWLFQDAEFDPGNSQLALAWSELSAPQCRLIHWAMPSSEPISSLAVGVASYST